MKKVLVLIADGSEEIEAITIVNVLRRGGAEVCLAGINSKFVSGSRKITIGADILLTDISGVGEAFDAIVLPGGWEGTMAFCEDSVVREIIKEFYEKGKFVCAICAAPLALERAGVLKGKKFTCYPGLQTKMPDSAGYQDEAVVVDKNVITSRGPATAMLFALKITEELFGENIAGRVSKELLL